MRLLNEIKSKMIIKKNLDLVFYVGDGDSKSHQVQLWWLESILYIHLK